MRANGHREFSSAVCATEEVVELSLLVPAVQAEALEAAAQRFGMTVGQLVRRALREFCGDESAGELGLADPEFLFQP